MKASELREKSVDELNSTLLDLLKDQFKFRVQRATGQLNQVHLLSQVRRDIARIKTVIGERTEAQND